MAAEGESGSPSALEASDNLLEEGEKSDPKTERFSLKKEVSLINGICIIVGTIIGSGIFISPTGILKKTQSVGLALMVWLGAGFIAIAGGLCYIELGTSIPKSGAEFAYLMEAFGPLPAYLFAWTCVWVLRPASRSIMAITFAQYVVKPVFPDCEPPQEVLKLVACVILGKCFQLCLMSCTAVMSCNIAINTIFISCGLCKMKSVMDLTKVDRIVEQLPRARVAFYYLRVFAQEAGTHGGGVAFRRWR